MSAERSILPHVTENRQAQEPIRAHHWWSVYSQAIDKLSETQEPSLASFCQKLAKINWGNISSSDSFDHDFLARNIQGVRKDEDLLPRNYSEDVRGRTDVDRKQRAQNKHTFIANRTEDYLQFFTKPYETPALVGPEVIDRICQHCIFGNGNGGLHCRTTWGSEEREAAVNLRETAEKYLLLPELLSEKTEHPERYTYIWRRVQIQNPLPDGFYGSKDTEGLEVELPLGFLRDLITYKRTEWKQAPRLTFQSLLKSKNFT